MKKNCFLLLFALFAFSVNAQEDSTHKKKFILASVSYEMGPMLDRYSNIDFEMMSDMASNPSDIERDLVGHSVQSDLNVEGSKLGASVSFIPLNKKENDYSTSSEIRLGLFYKVRGAIVSYSLTNSSGAYKTVDYSTRFKEFSLHGSYVWKTNPKFAERFTFHAGIGLGLGSTFGDKISVGEIISSGLVAEIPNSIFNEYQANSSLLVRAFIPLGFDYAISDRFDLGLQTYIGSAMQQVYGGESYLIPISGSVGIKLSYFL